jgi:hypothetical protein
MNLSKWTELLKSFLQQLPSFLAFVACIVFVIARWKRYPRVSLVLLVALIADLLHQIAFTLIYNWVPDWLIGTGNYNSGTITRVYTALGLITNTVTAAVIALYLAAIFANRQPRKNA